MKYFKVKPKTFCPGIGIFPRFGNFCLGLVIKCPKTGLPGIPFLEKSGFWTCGFRTVVKITVRVTSFMTYPLGEDPAKFRYIVEHANLTEGVRRSMLDLIENVSREVEAKR